MKSYLMTERIKNRLHSRGTNLSCKACQKEIEVGQTVMTSTNRSRTRHFHETCIEHSRI